MSLADNLQRQHLASVQPYASARRSMSGGSVWLNANESPFNNDYAIDTSGLNRYPAFQSAELNQRYAEYAGVEAEQVLSCRGSDEAIDLLIRAFCEPGKDTVMICPPTYGMYAISALTHGASVTEVPLRTSDWQLDVDAILAATADTKLLFLCSPSNPLGNRLDSKDLQSILANSPTTLVVVDEAYIEFCADKSVAGWLQDYPNLVILRTLSKAFALAGARCGFALAANDIIEVLRKVIAPYPLPDLTIQVASQALSASGLSQLRQQVTAIKAQRQWLLDQLDSLGLRAIADSDTNFILVAYAKPDAMMSALQQQGILIRNQSAQRSLEPCIRISVGSKAENQQLVLALRDYLGGTQ